MVVGEALVDLIESPLGDDGAQTVFRPLVGGAPLNVAAGLARLGASAQLVASISTDALGARIWDLLAQLGVGTRSCRPVATPTTLAVTSLREAVPEFTFYNAVPTDAPGRVAPSFAQLGPDALDRELVASAAVLYAGSIALMYPGSRDVAWAAWTTPGPLRILDPNVRPRLLTDPSGLRKTIEEFASSADLVKLSEPDATALYQLGPVEVAEHLRGIGARAVVVTLGSAGAYADTDAGRVTVAAPAVEAIDTTGAGDACVAALMYGLLSQGWPGGIDAWRDLVEFAATAASLACTVPGGATAMPSLDDVHDVRAGSPGRTG